MKLLLDQNLPRRIVPFLQDAFPGSSQTALLGLQAASDAEVWRYALEHGNPPGKRLESLKGDRAGQHSIRINDQWRICFRWRSGGADDVEIVDYH